jgi:hypothetical protein
LLACAVQAPTLGRRLRILDGTCNASCGQTWPSIMSLEAPTCHFPTGATYVGVCHRWPILLFFLLFSLLPKKYMLVLFFFGVSISVLIILIYNFFWSFYKNFIFSQFSTLIAICHILSFPIQSLFLWFLIWFLDPFVKILIAFNFILQWKFMVYFFFYLVLILLVFLLLLKLFF